MYLAGWEKTAWGIGGVRIGQDGVEWLALRPGWDMSDRMPVPEGVVEQRDGAASRSVTRTDSLVLLLTSHNVPDSFISSGRLKVTSIRCKPQLSWYNSE